MASKDSETRTVLPPLNATSNDLSQLDASSGSSTHTIEDTEFFADSLVLQQAYADMGPSFDSLTISPPTPCPSHQPPTLGQSTPKFTVTSQDALAQYHSELRAEISKLQADNAELRSVADKQAAAVDELENISKRKQKIYEGQFSRESRTPTAAILRQKELMAKTHAEWNHQMHRLQQELAELHPMRLEGLAELEKMRLSTDATVLGWMAVDVKKAKDEEVTRQAMEILREMEREKELLQMQLADAEMDNRVKREEIEYRGHGRSGAD